MPWAVRKEGKVSQDARTDCESFTVDFRGELLIRGVPGVFSIFWAVMLGVSEVGVLAGTYIVTGARCVFEERRRGPFGFVDQATMVCAIARNSKYFITEKSLLCCFIVENCVRLNEVFEINVCRLPCEQELTALRIVAHNEKTLTWVNKTTSA